MPQYPISASGELRIPIGPLDDALRRGLEGLPEDQRLLMGLANDRIIDELIAEVLDLLDWRLPDEPDKESAA